jgi:hypothetical protein
MSSGVNRGSLARRLLPGQSQRHRRRRHGAERSRVSAACIAVDLGEHAKPFLRRKGRGALNAAEKWRAEVSANRSAANVYDRNIYPKKVVGGAACSCLGAKARQGFHFGKRRACDPKGVAHESRGWLSDNFYVWRPGRWLCCCARRLDQSGASGIQMCFAIQRLHCQFIRWRPFDAKDAKDTKDGRRSTNDNWNWSRPLSPAQTLPLLLHLNDHLRRHERKACYFQIFLVSFVSPSLVSRQSGPKIEDSAFFGSADRN